MSFCIRIHSRLWCTGICTAAVITDLSYHVIASKSSIWSFQIYRKFKEKRWMNEIMNLVRALKSCWHANCLLESRRSFRWCVIADLPMKRVEQRGLHACSSLCSSSVEKKLTARLWSRYMRSCWREWPLTTRCHFAVGTNILMPDALAAAESSIKYSKLNPLSSSKPDAFLGNDCWYLMVACLLKTYFKL